MTPKSTEPKLRSIVQDVTIAASATAIWKALTDPEVLAQWFPLEARVKPEVGGSIWLSWGGNHIEESAIEIWNPISHLRTREITPFGATVQPKEAASLPPRVLDFTLTVVGDKTALHLDYSGFGTGADWDPVYNVINSCFESHLGELKFYLEHHLGKKRSVSCARTLLQISPEEAWGRLAGPSGLTSEGSMEDLKKGSPYSFRASNNDRFDGVVLSYHPGTQFCGTVENLNHSIMRLTVGSCVGSATASVMLSSYGEKHSDANLFEHRWANLLETVLA